MVRYEQKHDFVYTCTKQCKNWTKTVYAYDSWYCSGDVTWLLTNIIDISGCDLLPYIASGLKFQVRTLVNVVNVIKSFELIFQF